MSEKLCVFCVHLKYEGEGCGEYAEPPSLYCRQGHNLCPDKRDPWPSQNIYDLDDFREMILTAENCDDFKLAKDD